MVYPRRRCGGGHRSSRLTRSCISRGRRIKTQGACRCEEEADEQIASRAVPSNWCTWVCPKVNDRGSVTQDRDEQYSRDVTRESAKSSTQNPGLSMLSQCAKSRAFELQPATIPVAKYRLCICLEV